ncbi:MAG TPA: MBL fold metallo-hydrolase [Vicinamibacterales bacterium]|nr:MBL fold metallo-hydrolase [Vicinamibacterales bacterium]
MSLKRLSVLVVAAAISCAVSPAASLAQERGGGPGGGGADAQGRGGRGAAPDPVEKAVQLKPDLYYVPGAGANAVIRVTPEGLILIDTKNPSPEISAALVAQIQSISKLPVKYVLNTHHHPDHTGNNQTFVAQGATVVGLEKMKQLMVTDQRTKEIAGPPTVTFPKDYTLKFGGATVEAHFYGASHTGGDTVVYLPDKRFVMVSDTIPVANPTPGIGFGGNGGSAVQVPGLLDSILKLDWDVALAGRGAPMTRAEVQAFKVKWDTFMSRVKEAVSKGATKDTLASQVKQDDLGWSFNAAFFGNLFDELQANPKGEPRL